MKICCEKLKALGFDFQTGEDVFLYLYRLAEQLAADTSNLTQAQSRKVQTILDILNCIEP